MNNKIIINGFVLNKKIIVWGFVYQMFYIYNLFLCKIISKIFLILLYYISFNFFQLIFCDINE